MEENTFDALTAVRSRFEELNLHDCRLLFLQSRQRTRAAEVRLTLELLSGAKANEWKPAYLTFYDCAFLSASIDFLAKRVCEDAIVDVSCTFVSEEDMRQLEQYRQPDTEDPVVNLLQFCIMLCPPSGELRIVARDFSLAPGGAG